MPKIFGIGLSKTGTTSLNMALGILGFNVVKAGRTWPLPDDFTAATHEVVAAYFEDLDRLYPGSRFIYTVRDHADWLRSMERHWKFFRETGHTTYPWLNRIYGRDDWTFDRETMLAAYTKHHERVMAYFRGRELLVMDIRNGWEPLCAFLNCPVPIEPFPYANVGTGSFWWLGKRRIRRLRKQMKPVLGLITRPKSC